MEITFPPTNISEIHLHVEELLQKPTEGWQKTSDFQNGKKHPMYLGRAKEKRKNRDKRIGTGPAPLGRSCEGGKVSKHQVTHSLVETGGARGKLCSHGGECSNESAATWVQRAKQRDSRTEDWCLPALTSPRVLSVHLLAGMG